MLPCVNLLPPFVSHRITSCHSESVKWLYYGNEQGMYMGYAANGTYPGQSYIYEYQSGTNASCGSPYNISSG